MLKIPRVKNQDCKCYADNTRIKVQIDSYPKIVFTSRTAIHQLSRRLSNKTKSNDNKTCESTPLISFKFMCEVPGVMQNLFANLRLNRFELIYRSTSQEENKQTDFPIIYLDAFQS